MTNSATQRRIVIVGAGRAGMSIAHVLGSDQRYAITLVEPVEEVVTKARSIGFDVVKQSGTNSTAMESLLADASAVVVAAPDFVACPVANAAVVAGCHYLDLSENSKIATEIESIASGAAGVFVPGCGLAPGYISTIVNDVLKQSGDNSKIRVFAGVLPVHRTNRLGYGNMWSIDGLVTEYTNPCNVIVSGRREKVPPLSELETVVIDGTPYEAFTTAGSLDNLAGSLEGSVNSLVFKTLRYTGHLDYIKLLIDDLGLGDRLDTFKNVLQNGLPVIENDMVILGVVAKVKRQVDTYYRTHESSHFQRICSKRHENGHQESAVSRVTAAHTCSVIDLLWDDLADHSGLLHPEEISLDMLRTSRFFEPLLVKGSSQMDGVSFQVL